MNNILKRTAIVTGASGGIGAAIAFELVKNGIYTILLSRNEVRLKAIADVVFKEEKEGTFYPCDVTNSTAIQNVLALQNERLSASQIIMVNNAGYGGPFVTTDEINNDEWDLIFNTNVKAAFLFCKALLPLMMQHNWGRIINIASVYGSVGGALSAAYSASKHALVGYTKSIAAEWGGYNTTANCISPGFINTNMGASGNHNFYKNVVAQVPCKREGTPAEVASLVSYLIKDESRYINGANMIIDGGLTAARSFR